jgi:chromosome segregation ATPase
VTQYTEMSCPTCKHALRVRAEYQGKLITCKYCKNTFRASPAGDSATAGDPAKMGLAEQFDEARLRIVALEESLQQTRIELAARTAEQTTAAQTLRELQAERDHLQQQSLQSMAQLSGQAGEIEPLRAERDRLQTDLKALQEEVQAHVSQAQQAQEEMTELRKKLIAAVNAARNLKEAQNERDRLREESGHLRSQMQTLTADAERIGQMSEELRTLRGDCDRWASDRADQEKQWAEARAALEADRTQAQAEVQRLQDEAAARASAEAKLRKELEKSEATSQRLTAELEAAQAARRESEADRARSAAAYANRERQWAEEQAAMEGEMDRGDSELQRLQQAEAEWQSRLEASAAECQRVAAELEAALAGQLESQADRDRWTAERADQEKQWAEERAALAGDLAREHTELQGLQLVGADLQTRFEASDAECRRLAAALGATAEGRRNLETELERARERIRVLEKEATGAEGRSDADLEELRGKIAWYQQEVDVLRKSLASFGIQVEY